jgi:divalent metal cation (Fe/Co/Zn/Cd) transporter
VLAREMRSLLIGEAASERDQEAIRRAMASGDDVVRIIHLRTQHLGPDDLVVAAKVEFTSTLTLPEVAARIDALEARVRAAVPAAKTIFVEPDVYREA